MKDLFIFVNGFSIYKKTKKLICHENIQVLSISVVSSFTCMHINIFWHFLRSSLFSIGRDFMCSLFNWFYFILFLYFFSLQYSLGTEYFTLKFDMLPEDKDLEIVAATKGVRLGWVSQNSSRYNTDMVPN